MKTDQIRAKIFKKVEVTINIRKNLIKLNIDKTTDFLFTC